MWVSFHCEAEEETGLFVQLTGTRIHSLWYLLSQNAVAGGLWDMKHFAWHLYKYSDETPFYNLHNIDQQKTHRIYDTCTRFLANPKSGDSQQIQLKMDNRAKKSYDCWTGQWHPIEVYRMEKEGTYLVMVTEYFWRNCWVEKNKYQLYSNW